MTPWWKHWYELIWPWSELFRLRTKIRNIPFDVRDCDLTPFNRTESLYWKSEWSNINRELRGAHKGIARLQRKLKALRGKP